MYNHGVGVAQDYQEALKWYQFAAEQGNELAEKVMLLIQTKLGFMYYQRRRRCPGLPGGSKVVPSCSRTGRTTDAQYRLWKMYYNGESVAQDYQEAVKWLRLAAEQGEADAQYRLGFMYYKGEGVAQNYQEAVKWLRLAAEQGDTYAQVHLGVMYTNGEGVAQDYQEAVKWFTVSRRSREKPMPKTTLG